MKPARSARLVKNLIAKSTSTATSAVAPSPVEQISFYETCPHAAVTNTTTSDHIDAPIAPIKPDLATNTIHQHVRPYSEVPGPKPLPILGNTWR